MRTGWIARAGADVQRAAGGASAASVACAGRAARAFALAGALVLAGCAGSPPVPDWASSAHGSLARYEAAWLRGDTRVAQAEFSRARAALARTGRPELVAHAELVRCAMHTASLDFDDCPGFRQLEQDAGAAARTYADYLAGRWQEIDATLLPPQHRPVAAGAAALDAIEEPASRLVAAGVLLRTGRIEPADIASAVETASQQGWRRPLLAWLGVQQQRARAGKDVEAAAGIGRRMDLISR